MAQGHCPPLAVPHNVFFRCFEQYAMMTAYQAKRPCTTQIVIRALQSKMERMAYSLLA